MSSLTWDQVKDVDVGSWKDARFASERLLVLRNLPSLSLSAPLLQQLLCPVASTGASCFFGAGHRTQRFEEFLALVAKFGGACLVEVKGGDHAIIEDAATVALCSPLPPKDLTWIGFDLAVISALKWRLPNFKAYHVVDPPLASASPRGPNSPGSGERHGSPRGSAVMCPRPGSLMGRRAEFRRQVDAIVEAGLDGIDCYADRELLDTSLVQYAVAAGLKVGLWVWPTVLPDCDSPVSWQHFADLHCDFFTSDLPQEVWQWEAANIRG